MLRAIKKNFDFPDVQYSIRTRNQIPARAHTAFCINAVTNGRMFAPGSCPVGWFLSFGNSLTRLRSGKLDLEFSCDQWRSDQRTLGQSSSAIGVLPIAGIFGPTSPISVLPNALRALMRPSYSVVL